MTTSPSASGLSCSVRGLSYSVKAVSKGRLKIVDIPTLSFEPGTMTALAGPSGSGKSTLLYLLAGLLQPESGSVSWAEDDLARMREPVRDRWRLENAGFVFQSFNLVDELSPLGNVLVPARFRSGDMVALRQRAGELLDRFGVPRDRNRTNLLSNGEQQRVALARALLFNPKVIFADEPTASLDAAAGKHVSETLRELAHQSGKTVIVASHDPVLLALADYTVSLDHGRLAISETA